MGGRARAAFFRETHSVGGSHWQLSGARGAGFKLKAQGPRVTGWPLEPAGWRTSMETSNLNQSHASCARARCVRDRHGRGHGRPRKLRLGRPLRARCSASSRTRREPREVAGAQNHARRNWSAAHLLPRAECAHWQGPQGYSDKIRTSRSRFASSSDHPCSIIHSALSCPPARPPPCSAVFGFRRSCVSARLRPSSSLRPLPASAPASQSPSSDRSNVFQPPSPSLSIPALPSS